MASASSTTAPPAARKSGRVLSGLFAHARWLALLCGVASALVYLLPVSVPGERLLLLILLAGFWTGMLAAVCKYPLLRLPVLLAASIQFFPVRTGTTRLLLLLGLTSFWLCAVITFRKHRTALVPLVGLPVLLGGFLLLPGWPVDPIALRAEYLRSLTPYRDTTYIWGGENRIGIDCSGLVRCGWIDACLRQGIRTANPALVRQAIQTWQQDCSAQELGEGYRGRTALLLSTPSLNQLDYGSLLPGDVAVTASGAHTLAYLGNETWIEADPLLGRVGTLQANASRSAWLGMPMKIVRWRALENPPHNAE